MRKVTCGAALGLYNRVLKQERPGSRGVTIRAEGVLPARRSWTLLLLGAMRIVAICASNEPGLDIVTRRHVELSLDLRMTAIAELRLVDFEEGLRTATGMNAVARSAAHPIFPVRGAVKARMFALVASEAQLVHLCLGS